MGRKLLVQEWLLIYLGYSILLSASQVQGALREVASHLGGLKRMSYGLMVGDTSRQKTLVFQPGLIVGNTLPQSEAVLQGETPGGWGSELCFKR